MTATLEWGEWSAARPLITHQIIIIIIIIIITVFPTDTVFTRDIVCLRNRSINTLHKGDDDDDDNNNNNKNKNKTKS